MNKKFDLRLLTEIGLVIALVIILDQLKLWRMPQGGSVTLALIPLILLAFRHGLVPGLTAGGISGLIQIFMGGYVVHPLQAILDYPLAFMLVGLAGLFYHQFHKTEGRKALYLAAGIGVGILGRFISHVVAGVVFFAEYAPEGTPALTYSVTYNATFLIPEAIITFVAMMVLRYHPSLFARRG